MYREKQSKNLHTTHLRNMINMLLNVIAKLYNKKKKSHIALKADFFVPGDVQVNSLTEEIRNDIKQNVEAFYRITSIKIRG